jgi:hypothetical protein
MDTVKLLAHEIGPRLACSREETRAADTCAARLSEWGHHTDIQEFESRPSYATWFVLYLSISLLGAVLLSWWPLATLGLGAAGLVLYARDADGRPLLKPRGGVSRNVLARSSTEPPRVIFLAHLDSARSSPSFHPKMVGNLRGSVLALNAALVAVPTSGAIAWFFEAGRAEGPVAWPVSALFGGYLLFAIALLLYGRLQMEPVPGANDNASGVEVVMRIAKRWEGPSAWFLLTGSEESGMIGIQAFIERYEDDAAAALFVNVDSVGAGTLIAAGTEGLVRERRPRGALLDTAAALGAEVRPFRGMPTDATPLLGRKFNAISLLAVDERGVIPNWHWPTDDMSQVDPEILDLAEKVARGLAREVLAEQDQAGRGGPEQ